MFSKFHLGSALIWGTIFLIGGALVLGLVALISSSLEETNEPESGYVTALTHYEASTSRYCRVFVRSICTNWGERENPPRWEVQYEDEAGNAGDDDITPEQFATLHIGDFYQKNIH